ncbi:S49 family peptidase [Rhodoligotrophos defluvii]|uniref:S49 family peptidase n=1 Tax=Rhodoligotrophos defluvii TaxID=2561934 RepID=UPI0010C9CD5C|nr:S49 family peptidase [Rhodoligotrophos defluvii]
MSLLPASLRDRFAAWKVRAFDRKPIIPVVRLSGTIGIGGLRRSSLTLTSVGPMLERAFRIKKAAAVALLVNSPGGTAVQAGLIFQRLRMLAEKHDRKVYVFVEDVAASGGYYVALAGDEIYADASSIVGSIGVVSAGFGFVGALQKLGIERRVYTAGADKAILDPFQPEKPEDVEHLKSIQKDIHESFKDVVRNRRGERLKAPDDELFTGRFWSGSKALELGLIDGLGEMHAILAEKLGAEPELRVIGPRESWLVRRFGRIPGLHGTRIAPQDFTAVMAQDIIAAIEDRALWSRFGL